MSKPFFQENIVNLSSGELARRVVKFNAWFESVSDSFFSRDWYICITLYTFSAVCMCEQKTSRKRKKCLSFYTPEDGLR